MKPRSGYIPPSSSFTHERKTPRARCSARRSRPGSRSSRRSTRRDLRPRTRRADHPSAARKRSGAASATATSARARRASSTSTESAAGRSREEDHPVGLSWNLGVLLHHPRLTTPVLVGRDRHGSPHAVVELAPELGHETLLVIPQPRVALGEEDLAMARLHSEELQSCSQQNVGWPRRRGGRRLCQTVDLTQVASPRSRPKTSTGPAPAPTLVSPCR